MYEMYPDAWHVTDERHSSELGDGSDRPRRRVRKAHSVAPVVHLASAGRETRPSA